MRKILIGLVLVALLIGLGVYIPKVIHETVQTRTTGQRYLVALGDSVAAGAGLSESSRQPGGCDVAPTSFPFVLGQTLGEPVEQFACSGATLAATAANTTNTVTAQLSKAQPFLMGSDVVVTAGANDIGWIQTLLSCTQTNCDTAATRAALSSKIKTMQTNLVNLLDNIQQDQPRKVVVNTYYSLLVDGDTCFAASGITPEKISFINQQEALLNKAVTTANTQAKATTVTIDFSGHLLCSADPWIQNITDKAPLHPTIAGQQQIAAQDALVLENSSR